MNRWIKAIKGTAAVFLLICTFMIMGMTTQAAGLSADNSLSSITLSEGTLSPSFVYNHVNYSVDVSSDTSSIEVEARTSSSMASIQSGTGITPLQDGANTIRIVVQAENGNQATYTITVNRGAASSVTTSDGAAETDTDVDGGETDSDITDSDSPDVSGTNTAEGDLTQIISGAEGYTVASSIPESVIPTGFTQTQATYQGEEVSALKFDYADVTLLYMENAEGSGELFIYDAVTASVYPYISLHSGDNYIVLLQKPADVIADLVFTSSALTIDDKNVTDAYQSTAENGADFFLFYAVNQSGAAGWYQYDVIEQTYQRYHAVAVSDEDSDNSEFLQTAYNDLSDKYTAIKDKDTKLLAGAIIIIAILLIIIVNLLLRGGRRSSDDEFLDEEEEKQISARAEKRRKKREERLREKESRRFDTDMIEIEKDSEEDIDMLLEEPETSRRASTKKEKVKKSRRSADIFDKKEKKARKSASIDTYEDDTLFDEGLFEEPEDEDQELQAHSRKHTDKKGKEKEFDDIEILDLNDL